MTDEIVDLNAKREERTGYYAGQAICRKCRHEWTAICPDTANPFFLECEKCGRMDGKMTAHGLDPIDIQQHYEQRIKDDRFRAYIEADN